MNEFCVHEQASAEKLKRLLSTIGLCRRAGGLVFGTPMVCEAMKNQKGILAVIEAFDTSDNTHKKLLSKCAYYKVPHYRIDATAEILARTIGKTGAVAAVGICSQISSLFFSCSTIEKSISFSGYNFMNIVST